MRHYSQNKLTLVGTKVILKGSTKLLIKSNTRI